MSIDLQFDEILREAEQYDPEMMRRQIAFDQEIQYNDEVVRNTESLT